MKLFFMVREALITILVYNILINTMLIDSVRTQLIGMPVYISGFFCLDWMGFDRETKIHFLTAFLISLAFFVESCICDGHTRAVSQSYINRSRQINVNWNRG